MKKKEEYKGWSLFNEVEDPTLRAWNRCAVVFNMREMNDVAHETYMEKVDSVGKSQMLAMFQYIEKLGYDTARRNVFGKLSAVGGVH